MSSSKTSSEGPPFNENLSYLEKLSSADDSDKAPIAYTESQVEAGHHHYLRRLSDEDLEADIRSLQHSLGHQSHLPDLDEQNALSKILTERSRPASLIEKLPNLGGGRQYPTDVGDSKAFQVDFDGPDDPLHPFNWTFKHKIRVAVPLALCALVAAWGSSVFSVAVGVLAEKFHVATVVTNLGVSLYVVGFAAGPVIWSPLSEVYGRKPAMVISMFLYVCFVFASATAENLQTLLICRFFSGMAGSSPLTIVAASFADMFTIRTRGKAIDIFCCTFLCGPLLAPIAGGFIVESYLGWRWLLYITGIMASATFVCTAYLMDETYAPIILVSKAEKIRELSGNWAIHAAHENVKLDLNQIVTKTIVRPLYMLVTEPILLLISIYNGFCYAILYLCLSSYPYAFTIKYKWPLSHAMIPYVGVLIGMLCCGGLMLIFYEKKYLKIVDSEDGPTPEDRLESMKPAGIIFAGGILLFFWTSSYPDKVHWAVPSVAGIFMGYGMFGVLVPSMNYVVDCYLFFAASALAGLTFLRSAMGAASPLFADFMFEGIGLNWSGLIIGLVALVLAPVPFMFSWYGARLRKMSKFALNES